MGMVPKSWVGPAHTTAAAARHSASPSYSTSPELIFKFQRILRLLLTIKVLACGYNSANGTAVYDENQLP